MSWILQQLLCVDFNFEKRMHNNNKIKIVTNTYKLLKYFLCFPATIRQAPLSKIYITHSGSVSWRYRCQSPCKALITHNAVQFIWMSLRFCPSFYLRDVYAAHHAGVIILFRVLPLRVGSYILNVWNLINNRNINLHV